MNPSVEQGAVVVHGCPPQGSSLAPCCGRPFHELPRHERATLIAADVTCMTGDDPRLSPAKSGA